MLAGAHAGLRALVGFDRDALHLGQPPHDGRRGFLRGQYREVVVAQESAAIRVSSILNSTPCPPITSRENRFPATLSHQPSFPSKGMAGRVHAFAREQRGKHRLLAPMAGRDRFPHREMSGAHPLQDVIGNGSHRNGVREPVGGKPHQPAARGSSSDTRKVGAIECAVADRIGKAQVDFVAQHYRRDEVAPAGVRMLGRARMGITASSGDPALPGQW
jgi:hypothetical protein